MGRVARTILAAGGVAFGFVLLAASGCGLTAVGLLDLPEEAGVPVPGTMDASPSLDASADVVDDPVVLDVRVLVEAAPPPGGRGSTWRASTTGRRPRST